MNPLSVVLEPTLNESFDRFINRLHVGYDRSNS
jgi:hypothetical protein